MLKIHFEEIREELMEEEEGEERDKLIRKWAGKNEAINCLIQKGGSSSDVHNNESHSVSSSEGGSES